jgi:hypothetical protein
VIRLLLPAALLLGLTVGPAERLPVPKPPVADGAQFREFLDTHCVRCHDSGTKKGGLDLTSLPQQFADPKVWARWVKVHDRIESGEMPPKSVKTRPERTETGPVVRALAAKLAKAELARDAADGRATFRRLTRTEYENTIQDLFGFPGMPLKDDLPEDGTVAGFNKVSEALDVSHVQMARYMDAAKLTLDRAIATRPDAPTPYRRRIYPAEQYPYLIGLMTGDCVLLKDKKRDPAYPLIEHQLPGEKLHYYIDTVFKPNKSAIGLFRHTDDSFNPGFWQFSPILPGRYKLRLSVWSFWWDKGEVLPSKRTQVVGIRTRRGLVGCFDAPSIDSKVHEFETWLEPNDVLLVNSDSMENVHVSAQKGRVKEYQGPGVAIDWLDVDGPIHDTWPPPSHTRLFGDRPLSLISKAPPGKGPMPPLPPRNPPLTRRRPDAVFPANPGEHGRVDGVWTVTSGDPKPLLRAFLSRAFRRPATDALVSRYAGIVEERLRAGDGFEEAMRMAYTVALCSPEFLFRVEKPGRLDDWAIANRLSYFLWNSMPDDELIAAARRADLSRGGESVRQQVRRMLNDPRSNRFVEDFLAQWLSLGEIAATTPDMHLYPDFKPYLQDCMVGETHAFFRQLIDHNLGIANLIDSDFAMLNAELGRLYGIAEAPAGHGFWRVALSPGSRRGGLLTQGSILKVTANGTLTSPVKRGAWIMDRLVGKPPDPPPPNLTAIDPDLRGTTTIREQLDKHRNDSACAACHRTIDPPGFALESYDVIGRWRYRYRSKEKGDPTKMMFGEGHYQVHYRLGPPVDSSGETADGVPFRDVDEFKKLLLRDERQLARNYLRRLAVYATGREVRFADRPTIEAILDRCGNVTQTELTNYGAYRMRSLIEELVVSDLFLNK